jgi:hypothetical protein
MRTQLDINSSVRSTLNLKDVLFRSFNLYVKKCYISILILLPDKIKADESLRILLVTGEKFMGIFYINFRTLIGKPRMVSQLRQMFS